MVNNRTFQLSCDLFGGYKMTLDLDYIDSVNEITSYIKANLNNELRNLNLIGLAENLENLDLHCPSVETILIEYTPSDIVYICEHLHNECNCES